jgi:hypothetical protein
MLLSTLRTSKWPFPFCLFGWSLYSLYPWAIFWNLKRPFTYNIEHYGLVVRITVSRMRILTSTPAILFCGFPLSLQANAGTVP